ncbi:MAG: hypothetical protein LBT20_05435, partial [Clostridiales bacterium]|nr:hypothetical protein [Clostridiales bacterium]
MVWTGILIFALGFLSGLLLFLAKRLKQNAVGRGTSLTLDEKTYAESVKTLAAEMNTSESGEFTPKRFNGMIRRAYRLIRKKAASGHKLYEFEKWLFDNYYMLNTDARIFFGLKKLKPIDGKPAIVRLSEHIVDTSIERLNYERIKDGIDAYRSINPLSADECMLLKSAFDYAVYERIYRLSGRVVLFHKLKRAAARPRICQKYVRSSIYLYYLFDNRVKRNEKIKTYLQKNRIAYENVNYIFRASVAESDTHAASLISYLFMKDGFTTESVLEFSALHRKLSLDRVYRDSDTGTKISYLKRICRLSVKCGMSESTFFERLTEKAESYHSYYAELLFYSDRDAAKV